MKKQIFLLGAAAALFTLGSCSSAEDGPKNPADGNGEANASFMSVNIITPNEGTRAGGDQTPGDPENATYEEGFDAENAVTKVRFYFFNSSGNAVDVHYTGTETNPNDFKSYVDVQGTELGTPTISMPNVEEAFSATLIINSSFGFRILSMS